MGFEAGKPDQNIIIATGSLSMNLTVFKLDVFVSYAEVLNSILYSDFDFKIGREHNDILRSFHVSNSVTNI